MFTFLGLLFAGLLGATGAAVSAGMQYKANKDTNQMQADEAEKAYQRSRPSNQVADLVDAGLTDQQARQVVAGNGNVASYTPAPAQSPLSGIDIGSPLAALAPMMSQIGQVYQDSYASDTGGLLGSESIAGVSRIITEHLDELPLSASTSLSGFLRFARSADAPDWLKSDEFQKEFNKSVSHSYGIRALQNFFKNSTSLEIGSKEAAAKVLDITSKTLSNRLQEIQIDDAAVNYARNEMKWVYDRENIPAASAADLQLFKNQLEQAVLDSQFLCDPDYRKAYLQSMLVSQQNQALVAQVAKSLSTGQLDYLSDPDNAFFHAVLSTFRQSGITSTEIGSIVAAAEAAGVPLLKSLRDLVEDATADAPAVLDTITDYAEGAAAAVKDAVTGSVAAAEHAAGIAAHSTGIFIGKSVDKFMSFGDAAYSALLLPNDALLYALSFGDEKHSERLKRHYENVVKPSLNYHARQQRRK